MNFEKQTLYKGIAIIAGLCVLVACITQLSRRSSITLSEYEAQQTPSSGAPEAVSDGDVALQTAEDDAHSAPAADSGTTASDTSDETESGEGDDLDETENLQERTSQATASTLTGGLLNADTMLEYRTTYEEGFYYEPLSDNLRRYITGVSFPASENAVEEITLDELYYVHVLYYDFDGNPAEGELICNHLITQDMVEIFSELYHNEYFVEKIRLIDEYDGDDEASMEDNNTSCFNYRTVSGSSSLSKHALGLAIDINPLYNPYITYNGDGTENIAPVSASAYADRTGSFPYKIDESDLCYKLFTQHGFIWGGNWNSCKDYQHFQKTIN